METQEMSKTKWAQIVEEIETMIRSAAPEMVSELKELNGLSSKDVIVLAVNPSRERHEIFAHFYECEERAKGVDPIMDVGFLARRPQLLGLAFRANGKEFALKR